MNVIAWPQEDRRPNSAVWCYFVDKAGRVRPLSLRRADSLIGDAPDNTLVAAAGTSIMRITVIVWMVRRKFKGVQTILYDRADLSVPADRRWSNWNPAASIRAQLNKLIARRDHRWKHIKIQYA